MLIDELVKEIEKLKARILDYQADLQKDETRTRMALINPLLQVLGWDTSNPGMVTPEYGLSNGRADYALLDDQGKVVVFLEAKRLGEQLARHRSQVDDYARDIGCRYPALTDGNNWEIYDRAKYDVPSSQSHILKLSIVDDPSYKCALQFLLLWRPNIATGQPVEATEPIMGAEPQASATSALIQTTEQVMPVPTDAGWITLRDIQPKVGMEPPQRVRLPNDEVKQLSTWRDLVVTVSEWLVNDGALNQDMCPIPAKPRSNKRYSVNSEPKHRDGRDFGSMYELPKGLWLYHGGSNRDIVKKCIVILEHCGKDPATVHVQVG